jgi:hypothetical protein
MSGIDQYMSDPYVPKQNSWKHEDVVAPFAEHWSSTEDRNPTKPRESQRRAAVTKKYLITLRAPRYVCSGPAPDRGTGGLPRVWDGEESEAGTVAKGERCRIRLSQRVAGQVSKACPDCQDVSTGRERSGGSQGVPAIVQGPGHWRTIDQDRVGRCEVRLLRQGDLGHPLAQLDAVDPGRDLVEDHQVAGRLALSRHIVLCLLRKEALAQNPRAEARVSLKLGGTLRLWSTGQAQERRAPERPGQQQEGQQ